MPDESTSSAASESLNPPETLQPRVIESLDENECLRLLCAARVGRLGYTGREGPTIVPVVYKVHDRSIVFHPLEGSYTQEDLRTGIPHAEFEVVFEIDQIDPLARWGWAVEVVGPAHFVDTEAERASIVRAGNDPFPWPEAATAPTMQVQPRHIRGRRSYLRTTPADR
jgi:hypothetical protein